MKIKYLLVLLNLGQSHIVIFSHRSDSTISNVIPYIHLFVCYQNPSAFQNQFFNITTTFILYFETLKIFSLLVTLISFSKCCFRCVNTAVFLDIFKRYLLVKIVPSLLVCVVLWSVGKINREDVQG